MNFSLIFLMEVGNNIPTEGKNPRRRSEILDRLENGVLAANDLSIIF